MNTSIISKNKQVCLDKCYPSNSSIFHPLTMEHITEPHSFCPTHPWKKSGKPVLTDECQIDSKNIIKTKTKEDVINPTFHFDSNFFLQSIYGINSYDSGMKYLDRTIEYIPIKNNLRVVDCLIEIYHKSDDIIQETLINFYDYIIKKLWVFKIYRTLNKYIFVDKDKIYFKSNEIKQKQYIVEKTNFFIKNILSEQFIYNLLARYLKEIDKGDYDQFEPHNDRIFKLFNEMVEDKLIQIIKKKSYSL